MENTITVKCGGGAVSTVAVGGGLAARLGEYVPDARVIIVTDQNVFPLYKSVIEPYEHIAVATGERHKTLGEVDKIYRRLIAMNAGRDCFVVGFGGGIVTDMAGFAASTYMRGVRFGFVCSTLLGQVDAGIGGKNGVNLDGYKNMVGTFRQPEFVLCDTGLLATLPEREFRAGLAEVVKAAVIADPQLFTLLESHSYEEIRGCAELLNEVIMRAIRVKVSIVERDELEAGERRKLNLGHTFGHAIEHSSGGGCLHGEAVSVGLAMASGMALRAGMLAEADAHRIIALLDSLGLPVSTDIDDALLLKAIRLDKKGEGETIRFIFPTGIGSCEVRAIEYGDLEKLL